MLLNDLYTIQSLAESESLIQATILLQAEHAIFKGHFPGQPVLPGVCMMEMITEITGVYLQQAFRIASAPLIKFLHMIDPGKNPLINVEIKYQSLDKNLITYGKIYFREAVFMKFQLTLIPYPI